MELKTQVSTPEFASFVSLPAAFKERHETLVMLMLFCLVFLDKQAFRLTLDKCGQSGSHGGIAWEMMFQTRGRDGPQYIAA